MTRPLGAIAGTTQRALDLVADGANPHAAAKKCRIAPSTLYRALARARERQKAGRTNSPRPAVAEPKVKTPGAGKIVVPSRGAGRAR